MIPNDLNTRKIALISFLSFLLISPFIQSKEIYKVQDNQGNWSFSDVSSGSENEETLRVNDSREIKLFKEVWVRELNTGKYPSLIIVNNYHGPVEAVIQVTCPSCEISSINKTILVPAFGETPAAVLKPLRNNWKADYNLSIVLGDPNITPDKDYLYRLPFQELIPYQITQSFNGLFSHNDEQNLYAIDIAMPISKPILAARGGIVMAIEENNQESGLSPEYATKANTIYILHSDGTIGVYAHLDMYSALVKVGDQIEIGDHIGRSGNTGFSTGPHLHFTIWRNENGVQKSVPFMFDNGLGEGFIPHAGETLTHGFTEVKKEVPSESEVMYRNSQEQLALLQGLDRNNTDDSMIDSAIQTGKSLWDKAKTFLE